MSINNLKRWLLRKQPLSHEEARTLLMMALISVAIGLSVWTSMFRTYGLTYLGPFAYMVSVIAVSVISSPICALFLLIWWAAQKLDAARQNNR